MRLIDADALTERMKEFLCDPKRCDNYGGVRCRACSFDDAFDWIDSEPTVDAVPPEVVTHNCVPIKPLAKWLAGQYVARGFTLPVNFHPESGSRVYATNTEYWERILREMDWEERNEPD